MSNPPAPSVASGQVPLRRILLQKENLSTFDKTWLPSRLQPPKQSPDFPYSVYLAEYEQYLFALQSMKAVHLRLTRRDPRLAPAVQASRAAISLLAPEPFAALKQAIGFESPAYHGAEPLARMGSNAAIPLLQLERASLTFGSLSPCLGTPSMAGSSAPSRSGWETDTEDGSSDGSATRSATPTAVPAAPAEGKVKSPPARAKAARKRRARALRRRQAAKADLDSRADLARSKVQAAQAEAGWTRVEKRVRAKKAAPAAVKGARAPAGKAAKPAGPETAQNRPPNRKARRYAIYGVPTVPKVGL